MSQIKLSSNPSGTGIFTLESPATNTNRTLTLPDATGTVQVSGNAISGTTGSFSGDLSFNSGYGSTAVAYGCRAWVNFNGTGTVAIRASGNVTSITDNNVGDYTVNFTTAMPDANYAVKTTAGNGGTGNAIDSSNYYNNTNSTSACRVISYVTGTGALTDANMISVAIFR